MRVLSSKTLRSLCSLALGLALTVIVTSCAPSDEGKIDLSAAKAKAAASEQSKEDLGKTKPRSRGAAAPTATDVRKNAMAR